MNNQEKQRAREFLSCIGKSIYECEDENSLIDEYLDNQSKGGKEENGRNR